MLRRYKCTPAQLAEAAVSGYHHAFFVGVGFALFSAFLALILVRQQPGEKVTIPAPGA